MEGKRTIGFLDEFKEGGCFKAFIDVPLVLHGGTGISPDDFVKCSKTGIKKINIATATFDMVEKTVHDCYKENRINGYYDLQAAEVNGAYENAKRHILIFGSDNKAEVL